MTDEWGCHFYGKPEQSGTGLAWWPDERGVRHPLIPEVYEAAQNGD